jgi:hypothetical protein
VDSIKREILLKRGIVTEDTDGDGIKDTISFKPKQSFNIQFTLTEDIKNMGISTNPDNLKEEENPFDKRN